MTEQCSRCHFWREEKSHRDPHDEGCGFGQCRREPPRISETMIAALRPLPSHYEQVDPEFPVTTLMTASLSPATHSTDWCGHYRAIPAGPGDIIVQLEAANERIRASLGNGGDEELNGRTDALYVLIERVQALPNTRENMSARAAAVCAAVDYTTVAADVTLSELSVHAESNAGELVMQIIACLLNQVPT